MIQNILSHVGGVQHFGILSMCLFGAVFLGVLIWAFLQKKTHLDYMARVALDREPLETEESPLRFGAAKEENEAGMVSTRKCCQPANQN
jgi:hypothetical protein